MDIGDIISHTKCVLPLFTDEFTDNIPISAVSKSSDTVSVACAGHGLSVGENAVISNVATDIQLSITTEIVIADISRYDNIAIVTTPGNHNLLARDKVVISGANETEYNGTYVITVISDTSFSYPISNTAATPATGAISCNVKNRAFATSTIDSDLTSEFPLYVDITSSEVLFNGRFKIFDVYNSKLFSFVIADGSATDSGVLNTLHNIGFNGVITVSNVVDSNNFEYTLVDDRLTTGSGDNMILKKNVRISGAATIERAIASYTEINDGKLWGFFVFQGMTTSDDRTVDNDSKNERQCYEEFKLRLINDITFFIFIPTQNQISGIGAIDLAQQIARPIYKTLAGYMPKTYFTTNQQTIFMPSGHNVEEYEAPYLIYGYDFQATEFLLSNSNTDVDTSEDGFMANTGDTLPNFYTRAFRVMDWNVENSQSQNVKMDEYNLLDE